MSPLIYLLTWTLASVHIYSPSALRDELSQINNQSNEVPSTLADFGNPPYGGAIMGRLYKPSDDLTGCSRLAPIKFDFDLDVVNTPLLILQRGGCSFVVKARNAQNIGAAALIIADNKIENVRQITMTDDGTAGNIEIPVVMIDKASSEVIYKYLNDEQKAKTVSVNIYFEMNHPDNRVEYEIWYSPDHTETLDFLAEFAPLGKRFEDTQALFTPHFALWYCTECRQNNYSQPHPDCVSGGRYCAPDPDGVGVRSGRDIMMEDLRQLCIYSKTQTMSNEKLFWDYIENLVATCPQSRVSEACSENAMRKSKISPEEIHRCVETSFVNYGDPAMADNNLLKAELQKQIEEGVARFPKIVVNRQVYRGDLEGDELMKAVCAGFQVAPVECKGFTPYPWPEDDEGSHGSDNGVSTEVIVVIVLVMVVLLGVVLYLYRKWIRKELNTEMKVQVNSAVSQYFALSDSSGRESF